MHTPLLVDCEAPLLWHGCVTAPVTNCHYYYYYYYYYYNYYYYYVKFYSNIRLPYRDVPDIQLTTTKLGSQSNSLIQLIWSFHALCNMQEVIALPTVSMTGGSP